MLDTFWILQISNTWDTYHFSDAIYGFLDLLFFLQQTRWIKLATWLWGPPFFNDTGWNLGELWWNDPDLVQNWASKNPLKGRISIANFGHNPCFAVCLGYMFKHYESRSYKIKVYPKCNWNLETRKGFNPTFSYVLETRSWCQNIQIFIQPPCHHQGFVMKCNPHSSWDDYRVLQKKHVLIMADVNDLIYIYIPCSNSEWDMSIVSCFNPPERLSMGLSCSKMQNDIHCSIGCVFLTINSVFGFSIFYLWWTRPITAGKNAVFTLCN